MALGRSLGLLAACVAAAALSGCNLVYSEKPLFGIEDTSGLPWLRSGVWVMPDDDCKFDDATPANGWPDCAHEMKITGAGFDAGWLLGYPNMVLASGEPMILQYGHKEDDGPRYYFAALRPTKRDTNGRVIEVSVWPVQCGKPRSDDPPAPAASSPGSAKAAPQAPSPTHAYVTAEPLPGLEVRGDNCLAREREPVRNAAKASEAWEHRPTLARWVRDGDR